MGEVASAVAVAGGTRPPAEAVGVAQRSKRQPLAGLPLPNAGQRMGLLQITSVLDPSLLA